ncbi:unnamed protein product [Hymenolepis diminuta]|uniref:Uncharacterized protein n=1 Tax=Hymenolepis diminuta TaxID=6216 RepID=A0A564ZDD6_HYMDI|nr:unnamed protein product [Hymenolepis diminuta]
MEEVCGQNFSLFNARFNCLKLVIWLDVDLFDFAGGANFLCDTLNFGTLAEEQFRYVIFISGLQTEPWLPLRISLLKLMEE